MNHICGRARTRLLAALALGLVLVAVLPATAGAQLSSSQLDVFRATLATAKYLDVRQAIADGYVRQGPCVVSPAGTMGVHFENAALMADPALDVERPEILVYVDMGNGFWRLVALEYWSADADQNLATANDRPSLFGVPFDGPMPGHSPFMPVHYDLHVWNWEFNPSGMFAMFNPMVFC